VSTFSPGRLQYAFECLGDRQDAGTGFNRVRHSVFEEFGCTTEAARLGSDIVSDKYDPATLLLIPVNQISNRPYAIVSPLDEES